MVRSNKRAIKIKKWSELLPGDLVMDSWYTHETYIILSIRFSTAQCFVEQWDLTMGEVQEFYWHLNDTDDLIAPGWVIKRGRRAIFP